MSKRSGETKTWRRRCKERIVQAMGGACSICAYNKCEAALALHHLDPSEKDFNFAKIMPNHKNWSFIVSELRKCILVCHNCHNEIHFGLVEITKDVKRFDESYSSYDELLKTSKNDITSNCQICGKLKSVNLKYCSLECSSKSRYKVDWDLINLQEELKMKNINQIAEEIGCSHTSVYKRLKKLGLK